MLPKSIDTIFIHCPDENLNLSILFDIGICWAKQGEFVWVITSELINRIPFKWMKNVPEKEVLELLTFLCLPSKTDLIEQLNRIELYPRTPKIIIISHLDKYFKINTHLDINSGSLCCFSALEATSVCAKKLGKDTFLIATFESKHDIKSLQSLIDLYFYKNIFEVNETNYEAIFKELENIFSK